VPEDSFLAAARTPPGQLKVAFSVRSPLDTPVDAECRKAVEKCVGALESLGHVVTEAEPPIDGMELARAYLTVCFGHVAADLRWVARTLGVRPGRLEIEDTTRLAGMIGDSLSAADFVESRHTWNSFARIMGAFHRDFDLYLTPTTAVPPIELGALDQTPLERLGLKMVNTLRAGGAVRATGLPERIGLENLTPVPFTQLANLTGQPAMSVPMHRTPEGLPCGVQFMAEMGGEVLLYRLAGQLEEAFPWRDEWPPLAKTAWT
jgi:amidase